MVSTTIVIGVTLLLFFGISIAQEQYEDNSVRGRFPQPRRSLVLLQVLRRHGARTIYNKFPGDPNADHWVDGPGELTAKGAKQQYDYGVYLRETYPEILKTDLKPSEVQVVSSDAGRSINSGTMNLAAIFLPYQRQVWANGLGTIWRAVAILTIPRNLDNLLYMGGKICPLMDQLRVDVKNLPVAKKVFAQQKDYVDLVNRNTQKKMTADNFWDTEYDVYDWIDTMRTDNQPLPQWITPAMEKRAKYVSGLWYHMMYGDNSNVQKTRLEGGALTNVIINRMISAFPRGNSTGHGKKFILYSAHDNTVGAQLSALRSYNYSEAGSSPEELFFGANLMYELYDDRTVRIRFQNSPGNNVPGPVTSSVMSPATTLVVPGCTEYCPMDKLAQLVKPFITTRTQWLNECGAAPDGKDFKYPYDLPVDTSLVQ